MAEIETVLREWKKIKRVFRNPTPGESPSGKGQQSKKHITLGFSEARDGGWVQHPGEEYPHPATDDFHAMFDALAPFVVQYAGMTKAQANGLVFLGVDLYRNKENEYEVVLTAARVLPDIPSPKMEIITKHAPSPEEQKAIEDLEFEAEEYLGGKRLQIELDFDDSGNLFEGKDEESPPNLNLAE